MDGYKKPVALNDFHIWSVIGSRLEFMKNWVEKSKKNMFTFADISNRYYQKFENFDLTDKSNDKQW